MPALVVFRPNPLHGLQSRAREGLPCRFDPCQGAGLLDCFGQGTNAPEVTHERNRGAYGSGQGGYGTGPVPPPGPFEEKVCIDTCLFHRFVDFGGLAMWGN